MVTARSERRDREMAVLDAAVKWKAGIANKWRDAAYGDIAQELSDAVVAYCEHELAAPSQTRTNLLSPETAHEAEGWAKQFALTDAGEVFRQIFYAWRRWSRHPIEPLQTEGLTSDEIEQELERTHQSISARVNALKNAGWIIDGGERRKTRSGRDAIVWTPTAAAVQYVLDYGLPIPVSRG